MWKRSNKLIVYLLVFAVGGGVLSGCQSYVAPGKAAKMSLFAAEEPGVAAQTAVGGGQEEVKGDIEIVERKPTAKFPVNMVVVRVQDPEYKSYTTVGYGSGRYSVVTVRDVEKEEDFERLNKLVDLGQISFLNRLLLPAELQSDRELRTAASRLQADMILIYTFDTTFIDIDKSTPLTYVSLGFGPTIDVRVITTVSALLMDVRTGYIYATAEQTAKERQTTAVVTTKNAFDQLRLKTERKAFERFLDEFESLWKKVVTEYRK